MPRKVQIRVLVLVGCTVAPVTCEEAVAAQLPSSLEKRFPLRVDPKLQARLPLTGREASVDELLRPLADSTGLTFQLAPHLVDHQPDLTGMQLGKPMAWMLMEALAKLELEGGEWLKTPKGYELTAKRSLSSAPPPAKLANLDRSLLRDDPRLQIEVPLAGLFADHLARIQTAAGVRLLVDSNLAEHDASFGATSKALGPAWSILEMMAKKDLVEGQWIKTNDGYRLTAKLSHANKRKNASKEAAAQLAKSAKQWKKYLIDHPLAVDGALHVRLAVMEQNPTLQGILTLLGEATRLKFDVADNLVHHDPNLGAIQAKQLQAYAFLDMIATKDLDNGRWVKTDAGYRLEGVSRSLRRPPPPPRSYVWHWILGTGAGLVVAAGLVAWRKRRVAGGKVV